MDIQDYLKIEQTNAVYKNLFLILFGTSFVTFATFVVFWSGDFSKTNLLVWIVSAACLVFFRWLSCRGFNANQTSLKNYKYWLNLSLFWSFLGGIHWGLIPTFFLTNEVTVYTLFSSFVLTGYTASAISTNAAYPPAFAAFAFPASMMFAGRFILQGDEFHIAIGSMIIFFFVVSLMLSLKAKQIFTEGRELNFKNIQLMEALRIQKEAAEQATRSKDRFLAAASHDLRQPMHSTGLLLSALEQYVNDSSGQEILANLRQSNAALNHSFNSLLDVSRLDADVIKAHRIHVKTQDILDSLERDYAIEAANKDLKLVVRASQESIITDPILFERVMQNLLANAINYTPAGSIELEVREVAYQRVRILVRDTGIGIAADQLCEIFSEYYQIDNPERDRNKGFGLGLAIVQRLCVKLGIPIYVSSQLSVGTTFALYLPLGDCKRVELNVEQKVPLVDLSGVTMLVIDDDAGIQMSVHNLATSWGCNVLMADSEESAVELVVKTEIQVMLIIADYRLRENKTGIAAINRICDELNRNIPSIIVTGDTSPQRLQELTASGFTVLHKPVSPSLLRSAIQRELSYSAGGVM